MLRLAPSWTGILLSDFDLARRTSNRVRQGAEGVASCCCVAVWILVLRGAPVDAARRGLDGTPEPDDYLLYPERRNKHAAFVGEREAADERPDWCTARGTTSALRRLPRRLRT